MPCYVIQGQGHRCPLVAKTPYFRVCLLHRYACNQKDYKLACFVFSSLSGHVPPYLADDIWSRKVIDGGYALPPTDRVPFHAHTTHSATGASLSPGHVFGTSGVFKGGGAMVRPPPPLWWDTIFLENVALSLHVCYCNFGMSDVHTVVFPACLQLYGQCGSREGGRGAGPWYRLRVAC